jgi:3,4-dihydroxy 2-butanone 4-phosphate synthase/GTP cyclohydrolase II
MGTLNAEPTLVRVQSENLLADIFRAKGLSGYNALNQALKAIATQGHGVLLYIEQEQGGVRVQASDGNNALKKVGPVKMDFRDYGIGAQILVALGLKKIRLFSSTTRKVIGLDGYDLEIVEQVNLEG